MTTLITGSSGKLGRELTRIFEAYTPSHKELDINNKETIFNYIKTKKIDTIIHCAAITSIRFCEENKDIAYKTNVLGTKHLYEALIKNSKKPYFIYISTACVFPGDEQDKYYSEEDLPYPKNYYALTKLMGEITINRDCNNSLIIRTNFIERNKWPYEGAFMDRYANYVYSDQLAEIMLKLIVNKAKGVIHICGDTKMSMYEFARIYDNEVKPISLDNYNGPPLTVNMCLSSKKISPIKTKKKLKNIINYGVKKE